MDNKKSYLELLDFAKEKGITIFTKFGEYNPSEKVSFSCIVCKKEWKRTKKSLMNNQKCDTCSIFNATYQCQHCEEIFTVRKYNIPKSGKCKACSAIKISYDDVKTFIEEKGSTLKTLKKDYKGVKQKLEIVCGECNSEALKTFMAFKKSHMCKSCSHHRSKTGITKSEAFSDVEKFFKENGCVLISDVSDYKNHGSELEYLCPDNHHCKTTTNRFKAGHRCKECDNNTRRDYEKIQKRFEKFGHKLITTKEEYKNKAQYLSFVCAKCDQLNSVTWNTARGESWSCCKLCTRDKFRYDYDFVKVYFEKNGCQLLETEYKSINDKLSFKCACGNHGKTTFKHFRQGRRCTYCSLERTEKTNVERYGEKNVMFNQEICAKALRNSYKRKLYTFPSGRTEYVMGYEPICLNELLKEGINEDDIKCTLIDVPKIMYIDADEKEHPYYPDIFIKSKNKIIEVKSMYIFDIDIDRNFRKWKEASKIYEVEVRVYDKKKKRAITISYNKD